MDLETIPRRLLDAGIVVAALVVLASLTIDRIDVPLPGLRLRISDPWRATGALAALVALRAYGARRAGAPAVERWVLQRLPALLLVALGLAWLVTTVHYGVRVCGGLDSYGYVGAARLFASAAVREPQPLAAVLPFPDAARAATPLGFVVGADGVSRVPRFPPGLPLVMAAVLPFGEQAPFWIPIILGLGVLACVAAMARQAGDGYTAGAAASAVAVSPTFFNGVIQPMSDVPATFWLVGAATLSLGPWRRPAVAGVMAGMAVLTRPALLPAALMLVPLAFWHWRSHEHAGTSAGASALRGAAALGAVLAFMVAAHGVFNQVLYGQATASGYGETGILLDLTRVPANLAAYGRWITHAHTPAIWVGWLVAMVVLPERGRTVRMSMLAAAVAGPYLFYFTWDDWESTRFVLPALVPIIVLAVVGVDRVLARLTPRWRPALLVLLCFVAAGASFRFLDGYHVFTLWRAEAKYPAVGAWIGARTSPDAIVVSALHSGSLRYYANRDTVRWDEIPPAALARTVRALVDTGRPLYLALDVPSEQRPFTERFADDLPRITLIPLAQLADAHIYELRPR